MRQSALLLLALSYLAFISLGLPDTVLGVAWPFVRDRFGLSQAGIGLVLAFGVSGYFLSGLFAGRLLKFLPVGPLLALSSALVAFGLIGYAVAPRWSLFFPIATIIGLGSGAIDAGLNNYAARHFPVRHMNWMHACWSIGATIGPAMMTAVLSSGASYRVGYGILAATISGMALAFFATHHYWNDGQDNSERSENGSKMPEGCETDPGALALLRRGRIWIQIAIFFVYVGIEAGTGAWCFTILREAHLLSVEQAGSWTTLYWGSLTVGRITLGFIVDKLGPDRLLRAATLGVVLGIGTFALVPGFAGLLGLGLLGFSLAPLFPTLMARTPARFGSVAAGHAIGFQVSAGTLGGAIFPSGLGVATAKMGISSTPIIIFAASLLLLTLHEGLLRYSPSAET